MKHQILTNPNFAYHKKCQTYDCICGKSYKHASSLCSHKKKCSHTSDNSLDNSFQIDKEFVMMILKQNQEVLQQNSELQIQLMEVIKTGTHNINNTNSHNKTFNLQLFLNETCKDAMNIMDFVDSVKLQLSDLEKVAELGFVNGISNIIIKKLKDMDVTKRPLHCTDSKREIIYIKDENKWEKEIEDNKKIRKAIKHIAYKNSKNIPLFKDKYPDCIKSFSNKSDQYNKIIIEAMGGSGNEDKENENKIIKKIAKEVTIDKEIQDT